MYITLKITIKLFNFHLLIYTNIFTFLYIKNNYSTLLKLILILHLILFRLLILLSLMLYNVTYLYFLHILFYLHLV